VKQHRGGQGTRWLLGAAATIGLAVGAVACGGDEAAGPPLSEAGERGKQVSLSSGCAGCHGTNGQGGVGPTWQGLTGSDVELADGTTIVADQEYLIRAIKDPSADLLADYSIQMPRNNLDDSQVDDIVAYINDLAEVTPGG
jgi:cytochrome c oxidase subunit 2